MFIIADYERQRLIAFHIRIGWVCLNIGGLKKMVAEGRIELPTFGL